MSEADQKVVDWLNEQQDWLQEAAELLLEKGALDDADIAGLTNQLKTPKGKQVTTGRTFAGLTAATDQAEELRLVSIGAVEGIEKLKPREPLTFGDGNLSVIFGLNGSGKSGYTRILKRACGKRRAEPLRSNVYADRPAQRQCTITYKLGTNEYPTVWDGDSEPIDGLRAVDFFDADAATFYLTEESGVSYDPPAVALLRDLGRVCNRVREVLKAEQDKLTGNLTLLPPKYTDTEIGRWYETLSANTLDEQVKERTEWKASHEAELEGLTERLQEGDPAARARQKRDTRTHVLALAGLIKSAANACSGDGLTKARTARENAADKRRTAEEAAEVAAGTAVLEGVGSETWRAMWKAARGYSTTEAYPGQSFPVTGDDAKCVLCHQNLTQEGAQRLQDFEQYVQGTLEKEATAADAEYADLLDELPDDLVGETLLTRCTAAGLPAGDTWSDKIVEFGRTATDVIILIKDHEVSEPAKPLASPDDVLDELARRAEALKSDAEQLEKDTTPDGARQRAAASTELMELNARKWISEQPAAVTAEVTRLRQVAVLDRLRRFANSAPISNKATRVSEDVVTQAYADRFNEELNALAGPHARKLKVELHRVRAERGQVLYQLRLTETKDGAQKPVEILSEGEKRVVSLGAFLADVAEKPHAAPFVFDDPISSLDHEFEENVAKRLARLGKDRQVLVFTHRLTLLNELTEAASKTGVSKTLAGISAYSGTTGHVDNSSVWTGKTRSFNQQLLERAHRAKKTGDENGPEAYKELARGVCTDFRRLVERTVEDDLLNEIVRRHRHEVQTKDKLLALTKIQRVDCERIDGLMTTYSKYLHSQSVEELPDPPEPDDLIGDIQSLADWRSEFRAKSAEEAVQ